jgi:hypothetical protein
MRFRNYPKNDYCGYIPASCQIIVAQPDKLDKRAQCSKLRAFFLRTGGVGRVDGSLNADGRICADNVNGVSVGAVVVAVEPAPGGMRSEGRSGLVLRLVSG